jgi:hypothetical protein
MTTTPQYELHHPEYGTMAFCITSRFSDVVRIMFSPGVLTTVHRVEEDQKTGIKCARTIWDAKVKEGWTTQ